MNGYRLTRVKVRRGGDTNRSFGALILAYWVIVSAVACGARSGLGHADALSVGGGVSGGQSSVPAGSGGTNAAGVATQGGTSSCENVHRLFDLPATEVLGTPSAAISDDINGDGLSDVVTAIASTNSLAVLLGNGNGTFAPPIDNAVGKGPIAVASVDVDRDGRTDLVSVNQAGDSVSILLGDGRGAFAERFDLSIVDRASGNPTQPTAVAVGDLNRDGWPDLAVTQRGVAKVGILLGSGRGTFAEGPTYRVGGVPESIVLGDFDADGNLDFASASRGDGAVNVLRGNGDGTFGSRVDYAPGTAPRWIGAADFNFDRRLDLVVLNESKVGSAPIGDPNLAILLGRGDGSFATAAIYSVDSSNWPVALGDVNRDGISDLVFPNETMWGGFGSAGGSFVALLGKRDGTFEQGPANSQVLRGACHALGDVDRDGNVDLVTTSSYIAGFSDLGVASDVGAIVVAFGQGSGRFTTTADLSIGGRVVDVALHDLNGDHHLDLTAVDAAANAIVTALGDGHGGFAAVGSFTASTRRAPLAGDVNNDGILDLLVNNGSRIRALLGAGDGTFPTHLDSAPVPPIPGYSIDIEQIASGYIDVGANLDMVVTASEFRSDSSNMVPANLVVLLGSGKGTFGEFAIAAPERPIEALALGDLNGDDKIDLVDIGGSPLSVATSLGENNGTLRHVFETDIGFQYSEAMALGDLNRDGLLDLVVMGNSDATGSGVLTEMLGVGGGELRVHAQQQLRGNLAGPIVLGDVNGDGELDAIAAGPGFFVALGDGEGSLDCVQHYAAGANIFSVALGDVDSDGRPDVVATSSNGRITTFLNQSR